MAFRKVIRRTERFSVTWEASLAVSPWTDDASQEIAGFLYGTGSKAFAELSECSDGTRESALHFVTRARTYMARRPHRDLGYACSSLVTDTRTGRLVAVCLCCGPSVYHLEVAPSHQRQGIATRMLQRALTVCAEQGVDEFDLWRCDGTPEAALYEKLGFQWTDETEG
jgi:ribosomal protein S18 acetylase RimI-like enzyme